MALRRWSLQLRIVVRAFPDAAQGIRCSSSVPSSSAKDEVDTRENEIVAPDFVNHNPRNLEQLSLARKERGWRTTWPKQEYWNRLRLERTQHHVEACVVHCSGHIVVSASTREWGIKKHLYSTSDVTACENVGRVLAQRCLEAGINFVDIGATTPWEICSEAFQRFQNAMTEGGVVLEELQRIYE